MSDLKRTTGEAKATGNGIHIGTRCLATTHMTPHNQACADAQFLARAWNCHDELLAACRGLLSLCTTDGSHSDYDPAILAAKAAIVKATGAAL